MALLFHAVSSWRICLRSANPDLLRGVIQHSSHTRKLNKWPKLLRKYRIECVLYQICHLSMKGLNKALSLQWDVHGRTLFKCMENSRVPQTFLSRPNLLYLITICGIFSRTPYMLLITSPTAHRFSISQLYWRYWVNTSSFTSVIAPTSKNVFFPPRWKTTK